MSSTVHEAELLLFHVLVQIVVILVAARLAGRLAQWLRQPRVVGEIIGGLALGPSLFGRFAPGVFEAVFHYPPAAAPMGVLSQLGLILLMFQIGLEFDFSHLRERRNRAAVGAVSLASIAAPFAAGFFLGKISAPTLAPTVDPLGYSLFMATAFSITAIPILGRIMVEFGLERSRLGAVAITSAAINDIIGWILLAVVSAMAVSQFSPAAVAWQVALLAVYAAACWWLARPALCWLIRRSGVVEHRLPGDLMAAMLGAIFLSSLATYHLGIFAIFGGFIAGVLLYCEHDFVAAWKARVGEFVSVFFLPIFFTYTGLRTNVGSLDSWSAWGWCALIITGATAGKFLGAGAAARAVGMTWREAGCLGIMMNTRALMELIIINVGYDLGVIPAQVFTMLVLMAIVSTVITAPVLRWWMPERARVL